MKKLRKLPQILYATLAVLTLLFTYYINTLEPTIQPPYQDSTFTNETITGEVKQVHQETLLITPGNTPTPAQTIEAKIDQHHNFNEYKLGDQIQIHKQTSTETGEVVFEAKDFNHNPGLLIIFVLFAIITIIVARKKGISSLISVSLSIGLFYFLFLQLIKIGASPLIACLIFAAILATLTIPLIHGFNKKSLSSIIGISIGFVFSIAITYLFKEIAQTGAAPSENFRILTIMFQDLNIADILIASLFLGGIGALIDTSISIASAIFEVSDKNQRHNFKKTFRAGMEVGKDVLGSMVNTLLLAYLAAALPFLVLISLSSGSTALELTNLDFISLELTRTFISAASIVIIIPIVSATSAYYLTKN